MSCLNHVTELYKMVNIPEKDWKYLRSVQADLLSSLCERINRRAMEILQSVELSESEKYRALFQHLEDADQIIGKCFDDWRRSTIRLKIIALYLNNLLTEEHLIRLSEETKQLIRNVTQ
jgi:hypothetical protein